jgi:DNA repair exonuclease SbcCD nuclease subunit
MPNFMKDFVQIKLPMFCIHGNHDCIKSFGEEYKSILELGQIIELMNYFGKHVLDRNHLMIKPICITKTR